MREGRPRLESIVLAAVALLLAGCVGVMRSDLQYTEVVTPLKTRADVTAKLGEPLRKEREGDTDIWYYRLSGSDVSDKKPATGGLSGVALVILPLWWRTEAKENVKLVFRGDTLVSAHQLVDKGGGFVCGVVVLHGFNTACGTID